MRLRVIACSLALGLGLVAVSSCGGASKQGAGQMDSLQMDSLQMDSLQMDSLIVEGKEFWLADSLEYPSEEYEDAWDGVTGFSYRIALSYPTNNDKLKEGILKEIFPSDMKLEEPQKMVDKLVKRLLDDNGYTLSSKHLTGKDTLETDRSSALTRNLYENISTRVLYQNDLVLSYVVASDSYSGGAHGMYSFAFLSFDKATGKPIHESDLFQDTPEISEQLSKLILNQFFKDYDAKDIEELNEKAVMYLSKDAAELNNNNFIITETGIKYCYNPYEIAPFATGVLYVNLPWVDIKPLMRKDSPYYVLAQ